MPRKKLKDLSAAETILRTKLAGLSQDVVLPPPTSLKHIDDILAYLKVIQQKKVSEMICFIMYDIEDNKIRREVCKYLLKKGCQRIQKSVYLSKLDYKIFNEIHKTLIELQEVYENNDSILLVPVSENELQKMKMIGRNLNFEITLGQKNTLFF